MASWIVEGTFGSVLEHLKPNPSCKWMEGRQLWNCEPLGLLGNAPERFVFRLQILHPPRISSSRATASRWCQHWGGDGSSTAVQKPGHEDQQRLALREIKHAWGIDWGSSPCWRFPFNKNAGARLGTENLANGGFNMLVTMFQLGPHG